jgi:hypothetical protein
MCVLPTPFQLLPATVTRRNSATVPSRINDRLLVFGFLVPRQAQRSQALHVLDDSRTASSFLLQCIIDFRFAPLIAFKYTFGNFSVLRVGHEILSVVAKSW